MQVTSHNTLQKYLSNLDKISKEDLSNLLQNLIKERDRFIALLSLLPMGIVLLEQEKVVYLNESAKSLFSKSVSNFPFISYQDLIDDQKLRDIFSEHTQNPSFTPAMEVFSLEPRERVMTVRFLPFRQEGEEKELLLAMLEDTTIEKRSLYDQNRLQQIEELKSLSAGVAHEIGNPLNSIGIHLNLLEKDIQGTDLSESEEIMETMDVIKTETKRLDGIIKNFLNAARLKASKPELCNLNDIILKVTKLLKPELNERGIKLALFLDENIKLSFFDEEQIKQMLINLIKNAVEAIKMDGLVQIRTEIHSKLICLSIKDTGEGISDENLKQIFDTYFTTKKKGSGLGLMIVYNIVRDHGGRIEVSSVMKEGTEFRILFPLREELLGLPEGVTRK